MKNILKAVRIKEIFAVWQFLQKMKQMNLTLFLVILLTNLMISSLAMNQALNPAAKIQTLNRQQILMQMFMDMLVRYNF